MSKIALVFAFVFLVAASTATPTFSLNLQKTFGQPGGLLASSQNAGGILGIILSKLQFFVNKPNPQITTTTTRRPRPKTTKATSVSSSTDVTTTSSVGSTHSSDGDKDFEEIKKQLEAKTPESTSVGVEDVTTTSTTESAAIESSSKDADLSETEEEMKDQKIVTETKDPEKVLNITDDFGKEINDFFLSKDGDDNKSQNKEQGSEVTDFRLMKDRDTSLKISNSNEIDSSLEDIAVRNGTNSSQDE